MKLPFSYFAGPALGYSAKFAFKRTDNPLSIYVSYDSELCVRITAFKFELTFDVTDSSEQKKRDDVYFDT